ncbi:MAG: lipopolysaccharide biosynthesis protein, partial [Bacteroidaceae bacterium]|nr:lipopolysaccharide biosynthesis protein [Bacteroidaceae bacterium]
MAEDSLKRQSVRGVMWTALDTFSVQFIQFFIGLVLARLLSPSDYGTTGMLAIFFAVSQVFIDSGFASAIIRKQDCTENDINTVFYFNIVVSTFAYIILFFAAPYIAGFFNMPILESITRILGLTLIINAFGAIQNNLLTKKVDFKSRAKISVTNTIISGSIGIYLAYNGLGVWALVYQTVLSSISNLILLWWIGGWRPRLIFSWKSFREMFAYGSKLLMGNIIWQIYNNLTSLLIGKFYTPADLGNYTRGRGYAGLPASTISSILGRVTFPVLAQIQDDNSRLLAAYRKYIRTTSMAIFFGMLLLLSLAKPVVIFTVTEKWAPCIAFLQVSCLFLMFDHINSININLLNVKGRSDLTLKMEIIKRIVSFAILLLTVNFGVMAICWGFVLNTQIAMVVNTYYNGKLFNFGYFDQWKDFVPYLI